MGLKLSSFFSCIGHISLNVEELDMQLKGVILLKTKPKGVVFFMKRECYYD